MSKPRLNIKKLIYEAGKFSTFESAHFNKSLYGVTDGKAVGTYFEHKFKNHLLETYEYTPGSSASGIDFPEIAVDMKVTSIKQPQSSAPYKNARQKIFGLGYSLLVFIYEKKDRENDKTGNLNILHVVFVEKQRTADFQLTKGILEIIKNQGNEEDLAAFLLDRNLPVDEIAAGEIAAEIIRHPPKQGYLTISNALQWRLQYSRVIEQAGSISGVLRVR